MIIAAYATGSSKGILYLRGEYASLKEKISAAIHELERKHFLGDNILGGNFSFSIELHMGAGAYICGEESALLESIEGKLSLIHIFIKSQRMTPERNARFLSCISVSTAEVRMDFRD